MAATALPRFMDVTEEAHASVVNGVRGGLQSGTALYHAQWIAEGQPVQSTAISDFGSLLTTAEGYPYGTGSNTSHDIEDQGDCSAVFSNVLQAGAPGITAVANLVAVVDETNDFTTHHSGDDCIFYYTSEKSAAGDAIPTLTYDSETGTVTAGTQLLPTP
jgi:hypothetical protein